MERTRLSVWRLVAALFVLCAAMACGQQSCSCAAPLDRPMEENTRVYDAIQARLTPAAFDFIETNLPDIISTFLEGGLTFDVPPSRIEFDLLITTMVIDVCPQGCTLTAEILDASITPVAPNTLGLDAHINLSGTVYLRNDITCDVPIHVQNKPVHADIILRRDGIDHFLFFDVTNPQVTLSNDDYTLDCSGLLGWIIEQLKGFVTDQINNQIQDQLGSALNDAIAGATCLTCDYYTGGCPSGSSCDGTYCQQSGACRKTPLGMAGAVDLAEQLGDLGSSPNPLEVTIAAGQWEATSIDAVVVNNGLELRIIGAADSARHQCVPSPDPAEIPSNAPPERLAFTDTVPGDGSSYMAGIGVSDAFLDWAFYKAYLSGLLCLTVGTETTDMLTSGTIALLGMSSLNELTQGRSVPVKMKIHPSHVPYIEVGAGTFTTDTDGNRVIDEPLLYVFMPGMVMDFWVLLDERWVRVVTITMDLSLDLALDVDADNQLVPLFGDDSIHIENVVVSNYELLADDPAQIENLIPSLVDMALPMLTGALQPIALPPLNGFELEIAAIKGAKPRQDTPYYDYLGLWANLSFNPPQPAPTVRTLARIAGVRYPPRQLINLSRAAGPALPEVLVDVGTESGEDAEYTWRLDGGGWHLFQKGPRLWIRSPLLLFEGTHVLEVRGRVAGDYRTLDREPVRLEFEIKLPPLRKEVTTRQAEETTGHAGSPSTLASRQHQVIEDTGQVGCSTTGASGTPAMLLLALSLLFARRR